MENSAVKKNPFEELSREELIDKCKKLLIIAQKSKQSKADVLTELENLKKEYEVDKKAYMENNKTLQELVDSLTEQKLNYITELDVSNYKIKDLQEKYNLIENEVQTLNSTLLSRESQFSESSNKISDLDTEIISLKRQNKRLLEENEQLINQLTELERKTSEFNDLGLQQREQLQNLEAQIQKDNEIYEDKIMTLNTVIKDLKAKLLLLENNKHEDGVDKQRIEEVTQLYESEKNLKEKANIKLKSYKDKILKCAACINQLKNSRFILSQTVNDYANNIPKWQSDIMKASKVLEDKIMELNADNLVLKEKLKEVDKNEQNYKTELSEHIATITEFKNQIKMISECKVSLENKLKCLDADYTKIKDNILPAQVNENKLLKEQVNDLTQSLNDLIQKNMILENQNSQSKQGLENDNLILQIKALESEKAILVREKLNLKDINIELENQNKILTQKLSKLQIDFQNIQQELQIAIQEKRSIEENAQLVKCEEKNIMETKIMELKSEYDILKKEYDNVIDLNGLLKEEVETLKISLEQPENDAENLAELNVSLQADIVKLETKLSSYKQENNSLLTELKESRVKIKEFEALVTEYQDTKSLLQSYKTENTELLNEMKEINQVLKERGEAISKLQKALDESEILIETLEKDREKVSEEKGELIKQIEELKSSLKDFVQKDSLEKNSEMAIQRDDALKSCIQKDEIILSLREELEKIKQHQANADLPNEDMSTSTISKAEECSRMKDLDETFEEKYTKLRVFALKLKKKLNETMIQLQNTEQEKSRLETSINEQETTDVIHSHKEDESNNSTQGIDIEEQINKLNTAQEMNEKLTAKLEITKKELAVKCQQLTEEINAHKATKDSLEKARRDIKKKNVLSLEMEDYERSMKELTNKMEDSKKKMMQMESTIDTQEGTITAMKTQIKLLEEQIKTDETQYRLIKEELQHVIEEGKEKDNIITLKTGIISKLEKDLEEERQKSEEISLDTTALLSEKEKTITALGTEKIELNNKVKRLDFKCAELNEKLKVVLIELEDLKTEYTSYKVRAQAVLRQNQMIDHSQEEQLKEETAALKTQIEALTVKLNAVQERCTEQISEVEAHKRRVAEATAEVSRAQQRTTRLHADVARLTHQLESERVQNKLQVSTLTQCYKDQIQEIETKHKKEIDELRKQLTAVQSNEEAKATARLLHEDSNSNVHKMSSLAQKYEHSDSDMDINVSMIPREEGEGSESAPSPPPLKPYASISSTGRSPVPLERLLEEGVPEDETMDMNSLALTPEQEISELRRKLQAQQQRVNHLSLLLAESERDSARMAQLSELLKSELRRVRGTTQNAHNTEYMKNVTLKFLILPPGDERNRLVPVLQKILSLSNEETLKIQAIAKGLDPNPGKGWGSYLPWPGGK